MITAPESPTNSFTFMSNSRRVSAPPPAPQRAHDKKRPSLTAHIDSPPKCRRRLSFGDEQTPQLSLPIYVIELQHSDPSISKLAWNRLCLDYKFSQIPNHVANTILHPFLQLLTDAETFLMPYFCQLLPKMLTSFFTSQSSQCATKHTRIICAVMEYMLSSSITESVRSKLLHILQHHKSANIFPAYIEPQSYSLLRKAVSCLRLRDVNPHMWTAAVSIISLITIARHNNSYMGSSSLMREEHIDHILYSFKSMVNKHMQCTASALEALERMWSIPELAARFAHADGSHVLEDVSLSCRDSLPVQIMCVRLLARLCSPCIMLARNENQNRR